MTRTAARAAAWDLVLGAAAAVLTVAITASIVPQGDERSPDALAYGLMVGAGAALALRRRLPRTVLAVIVAALVVYTRRHYAGGPIYLTLGVALYTVSVEAPERRDAYAPAALAVAAMILGSSLFTDSTEWTWHVLVFPGWAAAAVLLGEAGRSRRAQLRGLEQRARDLEETREEEARRRVAEERLRIARDLHDVVAHSIATINLQAGVAAHVLQKRPDHVQEAVEALEAIRRSSGGAVHELRAILDLLRSDGDDEGAPLRPTPGLDRLDELAGAAAGAGLPVAIERTGSAGPLPAAVDVAAYRIVQESVTNVMRHAGATRATVAIRAEPGAIEIEVTDDGRGAAAANGEGHGIAGMRERATLVGGTLDAGPNPGGGYRVRARLPVGAR